MFTTIFAPIILGMSSHKLIWINGHLLIQYDAYQELMKVIIMWLKILISGKSLYIYYNIYTTTYIPQHIYYNIYNI